MRRPALMFVLAGLVGALVAVPIAVYAAHSFNDVPDSNTFHADIAWLADAGVTKGCNPPANDEFCPKDVVTREQMAAFMRRLAENQVVDAGTLQGKTAAELSGESDHFAPRAVWGATTNAPDGDVSDTYSLTAPVDIDAPAQGTIIVKGSINGFNDGQNSDTVTCSVYVDGVFIASATAYETWAGQSWGTCAISGAINVPADDNIKIELKIIDVDPDTNLLRATVQGVWYPLDGAGNPPFVP